jgi:hypothetical protein
MDPDTDIAAAKNHYISVTPLHFNLTSFDMLDTFRQWGFDQNSRPAEVPAAGSCKIGPMW